MSVLFVKHQVVPRVDNTRNQYTNRAQGGWIWGCINTIACVFDVMPGVHGVYMDTYIYLQEIYLGDATKLYFMLSSTTLLSSLRLRFLLLFAITVAGPSGSVFRHCYEGNASNSSRKSRIRSERQETSIYEDFALMRSTESLVSSIRCGTCDCSCRQQLTMLSSAHSTSIKCSTSSLADWAAIRNMINLDPLLDSFPTHTHPVCSGWCRTCCSDNVWLALQLDASVHYPGVDP